LLEIIKYSTIRTDMGNILPFFSEQDTIHFDSHEVSKADSTSALSILDPDDVPTCINKPEFDRFSQIAQILTKELGMALLGTDVVVENGTNRCAIIDINAYPGKC
jgi:inositol-1,3,4-trisphosphate 5/6-kinase / inositol-tetrakisphosphate 1-kinase